jgi:hypothetical protein
MVACGVGPLLGALVVGIALARRSDVGVRGTVRRFTARETTREAVTA